MSERRLDVIMWAAYATALVASIALWAIKGYQDPGSMASIAIVASCAGFWAGFKFGIGLR